MTLSPMVRQDNRNNNNGPYADRVVVGEGMN
jgi:hypothetical protein